MPSLKNLFKNIFSSNKEKSLMMSKAPDLPMPSKQELDKKFETFLETISMPPQTIEKMKQMTDENKWLMICQYEKKTVYESPEEWVKILSVPTDSSMLAKFKVVITSADVNWMQVFVDKNGLYNLVKNNLDKTQKNEEVMCACLRAVRAFMNSDFGLKTVIKSENIFQYLDTPLRYNNEETLVLLLDLFTVVSWVSVEGHKTVVKLLERHRDNFKLKTIFSPAVQVLCGKTTRCDTKTSAMTFLNTMVNTIHDLEERNHTRSFLLDEGINEIIHDARGEISNYEEKCGVLLSNQFSIFEKEYENDKKETSLLGVNFGDPESLWGFLLRSSIESGQSAYLIDLMRFLLVIPNIRRLGQFIWMNCQHALIIATSFVINDKEVSEMEANMSKIDENVDVNEIIKKSFTKNCRLLKYSEIERLVKKRVELNKEAGTDENQYEQVRTEFHAYKMKKEAEIDELKKQIAAGVSTPAPGPPEAAPVDGGAEPAAPLPPGDGVLPPPMSDAILPPPFMGGGGPTPPPFGGAVVPPPMGLGGIGAPPPFGLSAPTKAYLPEKRNPAPNVKMKNLHWGIIAVNKIEGTVWDQVKDDGIKLNVSEFEDLFKAKETVVVKSSTNKPKKVIKERVQLVDSKRSTNVEIALSRFKMTPEQIRDSVLEMDDNKLNAENIQKLLALVPTAEEAEMCASYDGNLNDLGVTEKFFRVLSSIKQIEARLQIFLFKLQFDEQYSDLMREISIVKKSINELKTNQKLKKILSVILKMGNHMNGGTKKGGVYGYKLSTLKQLSSTKSANNKITLLQYLTDFISKTYPDCETFVNEFSYLEEAVRVEFTNVQGKVNKMKANVNKAKSLAKSADDDGKDRFKSVMESFYNSTVDKVSKMHEEMETTTKAAEELIEKYGEDSSKMKWEEIFKIFNEFVMAYKDATEFWNRKREQEEREKKKMMFAASNKDKLAQIKQAKISDSEKDGANGVSDNVLKNLKEAHSDVISNEILKRRNLNL